MGNGQSGTTEVPDSSRLSGASLCSAGQSLTLGDGLNAQEPSVQNADPTGSKRLAPRSWTQLKAVDTFEVDLTGEVQDTFEHLTGDEESALYLFRQHVKHATASFSTGVENTRMARAYRRFRSWRCLPSQLTKPCKALVEKPI